MTATFRVDPHVKVLDEAVVERAVDRGLDALVYAPHFTRLDEIERQAERYSTDDCLVLPGREVFTGSFGDRKHVLALGLDEPVPDFVDLDAAMSEFARQDATVLVPHPEFLTVGLSADDCYEYRDVIDAIEVYDPKLWPHHARRARQLAGELDVPAFGASYAHLPWTVGDVWTEFDRPVAANGSGLAANGAGEPVHSEADDEGDGERDDRGAAADPAPTDDPAREPRSLRDPETLRRALAVSPRRVRRRGGVGQASRALAEFGHLFYENSVKKFDRLVLSGREATHPHQPAYDGRFDDAFVY